MKYNIDFLTKKYIWDKEKNKPFDVFLEVSKTTTISLGWFDNEYNLTDHGIKNYLILLKNNNMDE